MKLQMVLDFSSSYCSLYQPFRDNPTSLCMSNAEMTRPIYRKSQDKIPRDRIFLRIQQEMVLVVVVLLEPNQFLTQESCVCRLSNCESLLSPPQQMRLTAKCSSLFENIWKAFFQRFSRQKSFCNKKVVVFYFGCNLQINLYLKCVACKIHFIRH